MRVLLLAQVVPNPPDAGPKIKTHYLLRKLAEEHEVELLSYARDEREAAAARDLTPWCERVTLVPLHRQRWREPLYALRGWLARKPYLIARDERRAMDSAILARLASGEIDVLHVDQVAMAGALRYADDFNVTAIFDAHNANWNLLQSLQDQQPTPLHRLALAIEWRLMRRFEGWACRAADLTLCVTEADRQLLTSAAGRNIPTVTAPIGIEVRDTQWQYGESSPHQILSVATMHYPPNAEGLRWFRANVWPIIARQAPQLQLNIVGARPPKDFVSWDADDPHVSVPGYVDDLLPHYANACAFIVPLQAGSGMRVKIIEAMARGVPVVSTTIGAAGLDVEPGKHLLIADSAEDFAVAIVRLAASSELRREIIVNARAHALAYYDWRTCAEPVVEAYRKLAPAPQPRIHSIESQTPDLSVDSKAD